MNTASDKVGSTQADEEHRDSHIGENREDVLEIGAVSETKGGIFGGKGDAGNGFSIT